MTSPRKFAPSSPGKRRAIASTSPVLCRPRAPWFSSGAKCFFEFRDQVVLERHAVSEDEQKYFSLTEAERLRVQLEPVLIEAMESRRKMAEVEAKLRAIAERIQRSGGLMVSYEDAVKVRREHSRLEDAVKGALERIHETGCVVKDLDVGLLDFPARINDEEVYLCWRLGEGRIRFYHRQDEGFAGRKPIDPRDTAHRDPIQEPVSGSAGSSPAIFLRRDSRSSAPQRKTVTPPIENRLKDSASPYLRSAAHQPVDWHEWGEEAFEKARAAEKPILLDIGAVWCHWCHVIDRESYDNPDIAAMINQLYIPVKVDRDERPDVDSRYQSAISAISGQGGWPLTAFLTPDGKPFFGGTYFPPEDAMGRPGFKRILLGVAEAFRNRRAEVDNSARALEEAVAKAEISHGARGKFDAGAVDAVVESALHLFDEQHGGFCQSPQSPHARPVALLPARYQS